MIMVFCWFSRPGGCARAKKTFIPFGKYEKTYGGELTTGYKLTGRSIRIS
jgi:hypothetical protein